MKETNKQTKKERERGLLSLYKNKLILMQSYNYVNKFAKTNITKLIANIAKSLIIFIRFLLLMLLINKL
jgi:hypothetical protein